MNLRALLGSKKTKGAVFTFNLSLIHKEIFRNAVPHAHECTAFHLTFAGLRIDNATYIESHVHLGHKILFIDGCHTSTVTICHSRTQNLKELCAGADILVAALGKAEFVTADMVKPGAVVIDVGITRVPSDKTKNGWKLLGDVKFDEVAPKCSYITPVPGGVGPMTIVSLMKNTLLAAKGEIYGK